MSWFSRKRHFLEETDALADDLEVEFDAIASAFNGLFQAGYVPQTGGEALVEAMTDIPGASVSLNLERESYVLVDAVFMFGSGPTPNAFCVGTISVDGADSPRQAFFNSREEPTPSDTGTATVAQTYAYRLAAGSHQIKMRAQSGPFGLHGVVQKTGTGFKYLVVPAA